MTEDRFEDRKLPKFDKKGLTKWNWTYHCHENLKLGKFVDMEGVIKCP